MRGWYDDEDTDSQTAESGTPILPPPPERLAVITPNDVLYWNIKLYFECQLIRGGTSNH